MYKTEVEGAGGIYAKVVEHSSNPLYPDVPDIFTLELKYHRFIHAEFMTHRVFSRNASSSRAVPVKRVLSNVNNEPAMPIHWGQNQAGMQAGAEIDAPVFVMGRHYSPQEAWELAGKDKAIFAEAFNEAGYHKQVVNRLTESHQFIKVVVTATEWANFFSLRIHPDAQPEIQELANCMRSAMNFSVPERPANGMMNKNGDDVYTHLPYLQSIDYDMYYHGDLSLDQLCAISSGRCARVSYLNHDNSQPDYHKDIQLHDDLAKVRHMSPFEHVAKIMLDADPETPPIGATHRDLDGRWWSGNFRQWAQYRQLM